MFKFSGFIASLSPVLLAVLLITPGWAESNYTALYSFATLAGASNIGSADGTGGFARFDEPSSVAVDASGNVYVADTYNSTIRKITPTGTVSTIAGLAGNRGSTDGTGAAARFFWPEGLAVDAAGNLYVADTGNSTIRKITPAGSVSTLAGLPRSDGSTDGAGKSARFKYPFGIAVDASGTVYVGDTYNHTIRKISPAGEVTTLAGTPGTAGSNNGVGSAAGFNYPSGLAVDAAGNVYVADTYNHTIRKIAPDGTVTTLAGTANSSGSHDGTGSAAQFNYPTGVSVDPTGMLCVADTDNSIIRRITPEGVVTTLTGTAGAIGSADGSGSAARFTYPYGVTTDPAGAVYVADTGNQTIRKITPAGAVSTLAGVGNDYTYGSADGAGSAARFSGMEGMAVGPTGDIFVTDTYNHTIRKITRTGSVTTFAGNPDIAGQTDGTGRTATFNYPSGLAADAAGNLYVADSGNHLIRMITPSGVVSTLGGIKNLNFPYGICVDSAGNLYVADTGNSVIRKITANGSSVILAGTAGSKGSTDGTGGAALFDAPQALAIDNSGNLFVADTGNSTIRKITPDGVVSTLAGTAGTTGSADGTGSAARFDTPVSLAIDGAGNIYVADQGTRLLRKVTPAGVVSTLGGQAYNIGNADGVGQNALFSRLTAVALDSADHLYVADLTTIRTGVPTSSPVFTTQPQSQSAKTGESVTFSGVASGLPAPTYQWNLNGAEIAGATSSSITINNVQTANAGDYTLVATNAVGVATSNKATLSVSAAPAPTPASSSGGGGGGAIEGWFVLALMALGAGRHLQTKRTA
jgi:sugar lactone lactonase YvrE